ncbi:MAG: hypothetical protein CO108_18845 [Deltaproteobacteria bacterium CG_4_9_14_3_um_filter_63_12]|nr:MAG: hypothetical protein COW42_01230 [Deltaproteobacteria bacterium CG17_big_fil_post_rev_8_21_14_2_50_63_7]PJB38499.1 MAG: hypothetical protein CO108_18845 [Deltaproteobacteria bacterium CG_4_9_14_3_um_filter_63_12]
MDFDRTLLGSDHEVSERDRRALEFLRAKAVLVVVATGRSLSSFRRSVVQELPIDWPVFSSGAGIAQWPACEVVHAVHLPCGETASIGAHLEHLNAPYCVHDKIPNNHRFSHQLGRDSAERTKTPRARPSNPRTDLMDVRRTWSHVGSHKT